MWAVIALGTANIAAQPSQVPQEVVYLTNLERRKAGLDPLKMQSNLMTAAQAHAEDMAAKGYFSHTSQDGTEFWVRCQRVGYKGSPSGENITMGAGTAKGNVDMWMNSQGHRDNMMNPKAAEIGVGFTTRKSIGVMVLGFSQGSAPLVIENEAPTTRKNQVAIFVGGRGAAQKMRFSQDGSTWGEWQPYQTFSEVTLEQGSGMKNLFVEVADSRGRTTSSQDSIQVVGQPNQPPTVEPKPTEETPASGYRTNAKGEYLVDMVFPVLGKVTWSDTFGAPRGGGTRTHEGQDLMAPKMRVVVAAFDGVWQGMGIQAESGVSATYIHLNNDRPGTDDGQGGDEYMYAPGIWPGVKVVAGQFVAYNGDSGNAEETPPHLHFELSLPDLGTVNAAASLRAATKITTPRYSPEFPELLPAEGQLRWDAEVRQVDTERGVLVVDVAATITNDGKAVGMTQLTRRYIKASVADFEVIVGDYLAILGGDPGPGKAIEARGIKLMRNRFDPERGRR